MIEVIVDNFSLLESRRDRENRQTNGGNFAPQGGNAPSTNNFGGSSAPSTNNAPAGGESNKYKTHLQIQVALLISRMMISHFKFN